MKKLKEYYEINLCPNCIKYRNSNCNMNIVEKEKNEVKTIICQYYCREKNVEEQTEHESIYTLPKKYYLKNFREI